VPWEHFIANEVESIKRGHYEAGGPKEALMKKYQGQKVPQVASPDKIIVIVAGGAGLHSVLVTDWGSSDMVIKKINLPPNWNKLLEEAKPHVRAPI
jgi:hypothetical protein